MKKNDRRKSTARKFVRKSYGKTPAQEISSRVDIPATIPPKDLVEARTEIAKSVREASTRIVTQLIAKAENGEVAPARYLFEMVGLYPVTEEAVPKPENSLAHILLERMGLPPETDDEKQSGWAGSESAGGKL
jgi:hypothetical protein